MPACSFAAELSLSEREGFGYDVVALIVRFHN